MLGLLAKVVLINVATAQAPHLNVNKVPADFSLNALNSGVSSLSNTAIRSAQDVLAAGESVALDPARGNCNACHQLPNTAKATGKSKIGISLKNMGAAYADDKKLRALIWDAQVIYPQTMMPPYGRHRILTETEIDDLTAWLLTQ